MRNANNLLFKYIYKYIFVRNDSESTLQKVIDLGHLPSHKPANGQYLLIGHNAGFVKVGGLFRLNIPTYTNIWFCDILKNLYSFKNRAPNIMTENQRLKIVRKFLNKTQVDFASSIGLTQAGYSDIERGKNNVSGKIKILLKRVHHVNMSWLESGEGEMFMPIDEMRSLSDHPLISNLKLEIDRLQKEINHLSTEKMQYLETIKNLEAELSKK